jgi:hypothetical protein
MTTLREKVQKSIDELQELLNKSEDDAAFLKAVKEKWPDEVDPGYILVECHLPEDGTRRLEDEEGEPSDEERGNVLIPKRPL